jgi:hypothetical protein
MSAADNNTTTHECHELVLRTREGHTWRFVCAPGDEPELVRAAQDLATRADAPFDWFDAAALAHALAARLKRLLGEGEGPDAAAPVPSHTSQRTGVTPRRSETHS